MRFWAIVAAASMTAAGRKYMHFTCLIFMQKKTKTAESLEDRTREFSTRHVDARI
jgi:hypothetical protein